MALVERQILHGNHLGQLCPIPGPKQFEELPVRQLLQSSASKLETGDLRWVQIEGDNPRRIFAEKRQRVVTGRGNRNAMVVRLNIQRREQNLPRLGRNEFS